MLVKQNLYVGMACWAAWGTVGWVPVKVVKVAHAQNRVAVAQVDPKTNEPTRKTRRVKIDRLVPRKPSLKGQDKPDKTPLELLPGAFKEPEPAPAPPEAPDVPPPVVVREVPVAPVRQPVAPKMLTKTVKLLDLLPDNSTTKDW